MANIFALREIDARRVLALDEANRQLAHLSNTDALTGLFNRRYLAEVSDPHSAWLADTSRYAVIMLDIDHFKLLNDHSGHAEGDRCLRLIAATIAAHVVPDRDIAVRYGGEEFSLILRDVTPREAALRAERLRSAIAALALPNRGLGPSEAVTVSIGVYTTTPREALAASIAQADQLLYKAKQTGRNRVTVNRANVSERAA